MYMYHTGKRKRVRQRSIIEREMFIAFIGFGVAFILKESYYSLSPPPLPPRLFLLL